MRNSHYGCCHFLHHYHHHHDQQQQRQGKLIPELAGAIFMCNNDTRKECFSRRIFGLPACREHFVRQVKDGMFLFLFDTDDRKMYGVFGATSNGGMNIVPEAFSSSGNTYPAQVQFEILRKCKPLIEPEFQPAILEKYFTDVKFNFDLNLDQVQRLLVLFEEKKVRRVSQSVTDRWVPSSSADLPLKRCYDYQQHDRMSNTNTLSQMMQKHVRNPNPNTEAAVLFMNSDVNLVTPRNINLGEQIDANVVRTKTRICHTGNVNLCQYTDDPAQQGVPRSSSLHLAQQQAQFGYCTSTGNCVVCTQKMVPDMASNLSLVQQTPCGLHVNHDNQQVCLLAYHHPNLFSSRASVYAADPPYSENIKMTVDTCSNFYSGSRLRDQVYNSGSQDVEQRKSVFLRLARNPQREAQETESCQTGAYPTNNQPGHRMMQLSHLIGNRAARWLRPVYNKQAVQDQDSDHIHGLASADTGAIPDAAMVGNDIELDRTAPVSDSTLGPGETQIRIVNFKRRNGGSKLSIELKGDKKRRLVRGQLMNTYTEARPDPDVVDGMVDPTAPVSNSTVGPSEMQIPFVNFSRRNEGSKLSIKPKGDKKRRLIRPSLELEDKNSHLRVIEGPVQVAMCFSEPLKKPSLVSTKSALDGGSMVITDIMDGEARVDGKNLEILQGSVCKSGENQPEGFQGNCEGERVLLSTIGIETERGNLDLDMNFNAEPLVPAFGQCRDDSNEMLVSKETWSKKIKQHFEESKGPLFRSDICLDKQRGKSKVETECVVENKSDGRQMILVSGSEKLDTFKLNKASANFSEGHQEVLVLGKKTGKKKFKSNPEPIDSEPVIEIEVNSGLEREPDNSKIRMCLHNEKINLVEKCIDVEPKANNRKTSLVSHKENNNPAEEHISLEPEADELEMGPFSFCLNNKPVEDYIPLESDDENSKKKQLNIL